MFRGGGELVITSKKREFGLSFICCNIMSKPEPSVSEEMILLELHRIASELMPRQGAIIDSDIPACEPCENFWWDLYTE